MMKIKKGLSILTSAAIACCVFTGNGIQADASFSAKSVYIPFDISSHPETYEPFEYGYLYESSCYPEQLTVGITAIHPSYRNKEDHWRIAIPCSWILNHLDIRLEPDNSEDWLPIVEEYNEIFGGFEIYERSGVYFRIQDVQQQFDSDDEIPVVVESKHRIVMEMCAKIMDAGGIITSAEYRAYSIGCWDLKPNGFTVYGFPGTEEEFTAYVNNITEAAEIHHTILTPERHVDLVRNHFEVIFDRETTSPDEMYKVWETLLADYPECPVEPYAHSEAESGATATIQDSNNGSELINLLTAIQQEASCDIDSSGAVEIADATAILRHYANSAAGIATASETNMDVNGDGAVGIDDATLVLTVYAELAAGLR